MLTDVHSYLSSNGQGTNLYIGSLPDSPDVVVALFQYQGRPPAEVSEVSGIRRERPGLQVQVRSSPNGYADADTNSNAQFATRWRFLHLYRSGRRCYLHHTPGYRWRTGRGDPRRGNAL